MIKNMPKETARVKFFGNELTKTTLQELREFVSSNEYSWSCGGKNLSGCHSGYTFNEFRQEETEKIYHCPTCNFDFCEKCNTNYGSSFHDHELKEYTFAELREKQPEYSSWGCDGRSF